MIYTESLFNEKFRLVDAYRYTVSERERTSSMLCVGMVSRLSLIAVRFVMSLLDGRAFFSVICVDGVHFGSTS